MTGFSKFYFIEQTMNKSAYLSASIGSIFTTYLMSAPAQKDLFPVPVIIRTFILSSASTVSIAAYNSNHIFSI
jgi:hypothetical protein